MLINSPTIFVHNPEQFDKMKRFQSYEYTCKECGKKIFIKNFDPSPEAVLRAKSMKCRLCRKKEIETNRTQEERDAIKEKFRQTCLAKFGTTSPLANKDIYKATQQTRLAKYGSLDYVNTDEFKNKKHQTQLEKYGDPTYTNREKANETFKNNHDGISFSEYSKLTETKLKTAKTNMSRYGGFGPMCSKDTINKSRTTKTEKYGDPTYTNPDKTCKTKIEKYGDPYYNNPEKQKEAARKYGENYTSVFQVPEIQKLRKLMMVNKYGVEYTLENYVLREKMKATKKERYGDPYYTNSAKATETKLKRYGYTGGFNHKYNYYGMMFDSLPELAVWIYCIDHNIPIIRSPVIYEYEYLNMTKHYIPDFWIFGYGIVEIKGDQFIDDVNNKWKCPYDEKQNDLFAAKFDCCKKHNVEIWYEKDYIKYVEYIISKYENMSTFIINNPKNPSYLSLYGFIPLVKPYITVKGYYSYNISKEGITPFDCDKNNRYSAITGSGITPFDIGLTQI